MLTIDGVDFTAKQFTGVVSSLKQTLSGAEISEKSGGIVNSMHVTLYDITNMDDLTKKVSEHADESLTPEQKDFVLASEGSWTSYSVWAKIFSHEEGVFKYI